jgi:DNA-binding PadR family transcriptional regulator
MADVKPVCRLCGNSGSIQDLWSPDGSPRTAWRITCRTCGTYDITEALDSTFERFSKSFTQEDRYRLSAITRAASGQGKILELSTHTAEDLIKKSRQPSPVEQVDLVLDYIDVRMPAGGQPVAIDSSRDYPIAYAHGQKGLQFILRSMIDDGLIERTEKSDRPQYRITMDGYKRLEEHRKKGQRIDLSRLTAATTLVDHAALHENVRRIEQSIDADPAQAIGSAKELVEGVARQVLAHYGEEPDPSTKFPKLLKAAVAKLDLPSEPIPDAKQGAEALTRLIGGMGQIAEAMATLRNLYGTGHGRTRPGGAEVRHARLVVGACGALSEFLLATLEARGGQSQKP